MDAAAESSWTSNETYIYEMEEADEAMIKAISWTTFVNAVVICALVVLGVFGNLMSVLIFCHHSMRAPINVILTALSLIDLTLLSLAVPVFVLPPLNTVWNLEQIDAVGSFANVYIYPLTMATHTSSIWTFVVVSVERYLAVCKPLWRHRLLTCRQAKATQTTVVLVALMYNAIRFWENRLSDEEPFVRPLLRDNEFYFMFYFTVLYILTHCVVPFVVILVLNLFIVRAIRTSVRTSSTIGLRRLSRPGNQRRTTQMMVVITMVFVICNMPPLVLNLMEAYDKTLFYGRHMETAYIALDVSNLLVCVNSSSTFIIYLLYCRKYRTLFAQFMLGGRLCARLLRRNNTAEQLMTDRHHHQRLHWSKVGTKCAQIGGCSRHRPSNQPESSCGDEDNNESQISTDHQRRRCNSCRRSSHISARPFLTRGLSPDNGYCSAM